MIAVNPLMIAVLFILLVCVMPEYSLFAERSLGMHEFTNVDVDNVAVNPIFGEELQYNPMQGLFTLQNSSHQ